MKPDLSVVIPLFNKSGLIGPMLDSLNAQKDLKLEIVVVDDLSTDSGPAEVEEWSASHPDVALKFLRLSEKAYAFGARVAGIRSARADDIAFGDADDRFLGTMRLARILARKKACGAELAHFRTQMVEPGGRLIGEVDFDNLQALGLVENRELLELYTKKTWPPHELWGKIYSRRLLELVIPWIEPPIYNLDTILSLLAMFSAKTYLGCEEFAYEYRICASWPMLKFVRRLHDLSHWHRALLTMREHTGMPREYLDSYLKNFLHRFIAWNGGKMCDELEKALMEGESRHKLTGSMGQYIDMDLLLAETLFSAQRNADKIIDVYRVVLHEFG